MSFYSFKIRNDNRVITGGTVNPMRYTAHTGNQQFTEYLEIEYKATTPNVITRGEALRRPAPVLSSGEDGFDYVDIVRVRTDNKSLPLKNQTLNDRKGLLPQVSSGNTINTRLNYKNIVIPINTSFETVDYGDDINNFIKEEEKKSINRIVDYERVRYVSIPYPNIDLKFRFYNKDTSQYDDNNLTGGYNLAGFNEEEINKKNNFKKSFFRLYFFDSNDTMSQNLLQTEEIDVFQSKKPEFKFGRIFWLKEDEVFFNSNDNRIVYMEARFFNAKTGRVHRFMNPPNTILNPVSITNLKDNQEWKTSQVLIYNPKNTNGVYQFKPVNGVGANTQNTITMTEYILKT
jgi:hypothetical protein